MKGARRVSYRMLVSRVKSEIPELYRALALNLYNPWADQCRQTATHFILVHSAIEYFIHKEGATMFDAGIVLNIGLIYRRGAMGTATTPATTPAQKIRIYRYIKKIEGKFFRCKIIGSTIGQDLRKFIL